MPATMVAEMVFILLLVMLVGGFVLLFPLTRRLGAFLEQRLQPQQREGADPNEIAEMRKAIRSIQAQLDEIAERQTFTESLLEERNHSYLSSGSEQREPLAASRNSPPS